jgi:DNA repair exonuclease SbcCD ATPase subunit
MTPLGEHQGRLPRIGQLVHAFRELPRLRTRLAQLEREVQECRRSSKRLAEVADVVGQLLLRLEERDAARLEEALRTYTSTLEPARIRRRMVSNAGQRNVAY